MGGKISPGDFTVECFPSHQRLRFYSRVDSFTPVAFVRWGRFEPDFRERFPVVFLEALPGSFGTLSGSIFRGCCARTTGGGGGGGWLLKAANLCSMSSLWYACKVRRMTYMRNKGPITDDDGIQE